MVNRAHPAPDHYTRIKHCAQCGWIPQPHLERCPRCGLPTAVSFETEADPAAVLDEDTPCRACGYNLRGLPPTGLCPECGAPIAIAIQRDFLCFTQPQYVGGLADAALRIVRGLLVNVVSMLLFIVTEIAGRIATGSLGHPLVTAGLVLCFGGAVAGLLWFLAGVWRMTRPEPGSERRWRQDRIRKLARAGLLVGLAGIGADVAMDLLAPPTVVLGAWELLSLGFAACGVIGLAAYFYYVRDIARRLPDEGLAAHAGSLAGYLAAAVGILALIHGVGGVATWSSLLSAPVPALWSTAGGWVVNLVCIVIVVLFVRAIGLHAGLRRVLEEQATLAKEHWRALGATPE
jgi:hypothetical protein